MAYALIEANENYRKIWLYDTFSGMTRPTEEDRSIPDGKSAINRWGKNGFGNWESPSLEEVRRNILSTGYPKKNFIFIKGDVQETIPKSRPSKISLLRLDTDWYRSTRDELLYLYPILVKHGVLIIDDYVYWMGTKKAVDEYFSERAILLNRIDRTSRIAIKIAN